MVFESLWAIHKHGGLKPGLVSPVSYITQTGVIAVSKLGSYMGHSEIEIGLKSHLKGQRSWS